MQKPDWIKRPYRYTEGMRDVEAAVERLGLNTVCREALCPNWCECFGNRTATFMILGARCTRGCAFCNVTHAAGAPEMPDGGEPARVAEAVRVLGLRYVVVTSVTRDDLPDGGAGHFAKTIAQIRALCPETAIEVLVPDFLGDENALRTVIQARPDVIGHNMETVRERYPEVRPQADYGRSLALIGRITALGAPCGIRSKSGFMVGVGETRAQVLRLMDDLREASCEFLTIGQYLSPSPAHLPVAEYLPPAAFDELADAARAKGFSYVASAPFVRSSYHAGDAPI